MHKLARLAINLLQSVIAPIVVLAGALHFVNQVAPDLAAKMIQQLLPIFVIAVIIQGALTQLSVESTRDAVTNSFSEIHKSLTSGLAILQKEIRLALVESRAERLTSIRRFENAPNFHTYIAERFETAKHVRVTHFSAGTGELTGDEYRSIVDTFLNRGGIYRRVLADTRSAKVWNEQKRMLDIYEERQKQFMLHYLPFISVNDMKALDVMLIDEDEVCLGGGYSQGFTIPVIAIRDPAVVKFFDEYYKYLLNKATPIRVDPFANTSFVSEMIERAESSIAEIHHRTAIAPRLPISPSES